MKRSRQGFLKRQKELAREAKKKAKAERLAAARERPRGEDGEELLDENGEPLDLEKDDEDGPEEELER